MKTGAKGALLASAVAMMFIAGNVRAQDAGSQASPSASGAKAASVKCVGGNDCKGKGACMGAGHDCKGQNTCKGKGYVMTSSQQECQSKGGHAEAM